MGLYSLSATRRARRHAAIDATIAKRLEDNKKHTLEEALKYALWSRNLEPGRTGFSPYQVVFGRSPHLPGVSDGDLLKDQELDDDEYIKHHFKVQEEALIEFRRAEHSQKIKDALKVRLQPNMSEAFEKDDEV